MVKKIRVFTSGANRNLSNGKVRYHGFRNPICEQSFSSYMEGHRHLEDGSLRDPNNWWKGWDKRISMDSLSTHFTDLEALYGGLFVYKEKEGENEFTHYLKNKVKELPKTWTEVTEEGACNAIRFNATAYLLDIKTNEK